MERCIDESLTSGATSSSDLEMYETDVELEQLQFSATRECIGESLNASHWASNATTPSIAGTTPHSPGGSDAAGLASVPRTKRSKTKLPQTAPKRLEMDLYMPLGSATFIPIPDIKLPVKWKESVKPPDCMPQDHPLFLPLSQLLSTACIWIFTRENRKSGTLATTRVYVLPDDVGLARLPRSHRKHRTALQTLIRSLDSTEPAWLGRTVLGIFDLLEETVDDSVVIGNSVAQKLIQGSVGLISIVCNNLNARSYPPDRVSVGSNHVTHNCES